MSAAETQKTNQLIGTPDAEVHIDEALVRRLLSDQFPDLSALPLAFIEEGYDNTTWALGDTLAVRVPRRKIAARFLANEQKWVARLAPNLPLPVSATLHIGAPTAYYPWPWSILPWFDGTAADQDEPDASQAIVLASFLDALHKPAPEEAPANEFRGVALFEREPFLTPRFARLRQKTDLITPAIDEAFARALGAPMDLAPTWLHGDLHARNVLVKDGKICAIIDWGDITAGDRATDLAAIWMLLDSAPARAEAIHHIGPLTPATWQRTTGWAISFGVLLLDSGLIDNARHAAMGKKILQRVQNDLMSAS